MECSHISKECNKELSQTMDLVSLGSQAFPIASNCMHFDCAGEGNNGEGLGTEARILLH